MYLSRRRFLITRVPNLSGAKHQTAIMMLGDTTPHENGRELQ
jgi:hypothetical protein